ncbi:midasin AAA ATPase-domain containing protein [Chanodichthys erythropterus]|uniref:midasin AAA ATPase-domain containing protein n=1 Tax=Chanodichthys erythropterus TaxID=933992 RepID=UPI00351F2576
MFFTVTEVDDIPVTRRGRGSDLKRRAIRENSEERLSKIIIRVEDIEAGVESPIEVATEEHLDDTFSVKESETLRSTTDTVTTTVTNISEVRSSQKEEEWEIEKDKVTATSEGTPVTHFTTAGEIKSQGGSEKECEMVNKEHTVVIQRATIGSIDQSQLQSVVDIEIVKMSTGTEEEKIENLEKNKEVETDKTVCEAEKEEIKQMLDEPEEEKAVSGTVETYNNTESLEETDQSGTLANKAEESKVEEYNEKDKLTVETDFTMDAEIIQVGETVDVDVVPEISEIDQEEAPQQSSVESAEVPKLKTTPEEDEETVENSSMMTEAKLSPKEASDNHGEIDIAEQDEMKSVSTEEQADEEIMRMEKQDGTLDTREAYNAAADGKITPEQSTGYEEQEGEPEPETTEVVLSSQVEKPEERRDTEQAKDDADKLIPKQGKQAQKKGSTDTPSRSTSLRDQPVDPGVTVRCLRSTSKTIKITPVRRSTRSKAVVQQVESVEPQVEAKFRTDENSERDEVIAKEIGTEEGEKANTNVDETVVIETGISEVLKATEIDDKEKTPQITEGTEKDIPPVEAEPDEDVTEKVKEIKTMENKEANLVRQRDICVEMSSLAQEKNVQEEEAPVRTEISLRRRTIRVQSPLRRKSRRVQNQEAEPDVEHQERHAVVPKSKSESISTTEKRVEEMDQEVNKMENKEINLAELEPVEEPNMIRNEDEKTSTEETVNVCLPIITTERLDDMKTVETAAVDTEKSELLMGVEIDDQEKVAEPDEERGIEDGTPVIKIQKATVVHVDLNKLSQNTEEVESPEVLKHSQMEEHLELDKPDKSEQELCNVASEEEEQKEEIQTQEDTEMIPEEEKIEEEKSTAEELNKLDEQDMAFEEQKPTGDLATMHNPQSNLVESNKNENNQNEDEIVEAEPEEDVVEKDAGNKETNLAVTKDTVEEAPEMGEETNLEQQKNEPLIKNVNETAETEKPMEMDPVVNKEQTYVIEETTIQIEEKTSQVESTETNQSDNERITRRSLRLSAKSVTESTQKTRKSKRLHKAELEPVKEADTSKNKCEETSATTERTVNVCIPVITVETSLESPDEIQITNVEKTSAVEPETSELLMGVETDDKNEAPQIVQEVSFVEAEPDEEVEEDDGTPIIQLQKATVVLVDLNTNLSQNTEGEHDTPQVHSQTEEQLELDEPDKSEYQQCIQTSENEEQQEELQKEEDTEKTPEEEENKTEEENTVEEQNKLDKQDMTFEEQKPTEDLEGQNYVKETEIVEDYEAAIDVDVEEAVTSKDHPEATTMADKIIQEADIALKEKQMDSGVEISGLTQEAPEAVQEILEEEVPVSTERSLRRRTIKVQSPPRRKSRRVQKQEAEVFEDKTREVPITGKGVDEMHKEGEEIDDKEETLQKSTLEATDEIIPLIEEKHDEEIIKKGFEETNEIENKETNFDMTKDTDEKAPEMVEEANLEQQENEPLVKNQKETDETEKPMEIDPVVNKEQTHIIEETTTQIEEKTSQVESTETNQSDNERITRSSLRLSAKSVTESTQKTRKSKRLHKAELEPVKAADMSENKYEETSEKTEETVNVCIPVITVEPNLESIGEIANTNLEETTAVEPETSEPRMGVETDDKNEARQIVQEVSFVEAEPDEEVEKDDGTPIIQLQKATVVIVDLNTNLSQNTEGQCDTLEVITHSQTEEQLELDEPDKSEYQQRIQTSENEEQQEELQKEEDTEKTPEEEKNKMEEEKTVEEQNKHDKRDMTFEEQKPTEDLEGQNDVKEIVEEYKAVVDEDMKEAVTSKEHPEATTMAENDQDIALKEKQMDSGVEISGLTQEAPEADQEILEEEVPVSTERSLRRRTIKVQSPPRRKSRRVQKQEAEVFEDKTREVPITEKGVDDMHKEGEEINDKEETLQKSTLEATDEIIPLIEEKHDEEIIKKGFEETNEIENKETNFDMTKDTDEKAPEMVEKANLEQQENEPLVKNQKETDETEKPMEIDPVVNKEQTHIIEETTIQIGEKTSQVESTETNQSDNERITRRSLRLSAKSVTESTQKTRKSKRLHKAELEPVKAADMSENKYEETSEKTEETVNLCIPVITVEPNLESIGEIANTNLEEISAVEPETSEPLMGVETDDKNEAPQIVQEVSFVEAEPDEEVEKDDGTPIIQLQKATVVIVDLNTNLSQNTEGECDTLEVLTHSQTEEQLELDEPDKSEYQQRIQTSENEEQQEELQKEEDTEKTPEEEKNKMEEENTVEEQNKHDKQDMTFEEQKPTEDLEGQNDVKEIVEEYKAVVEEDVEEAVTSKEHPEATKMAENDQDIALKEKQMDSGVELSGLTQEAPEAVQEILEEEVPVSTERSLRRRTIKVQSPPRRKSRRVQKQEAETDVEHQERQTVVTKSKTESVSMTEMTVEEMDQEVNRMENKEANSAEMEPVEEDTEKIIPLVEGEPDEDVIEKRFEEINWMQIKETSLENDAAPEMGREDANLEQHENEPLVKNEKETAEAEKPMEVDKVPVLCNEQTCIIEETTIQEKVAQMESSETNENKSERITRRSVRISGKPVTSTKKTRKSTRLHTAELEPVKEADMSGNEETSSTTVETANVCLPIITVEASVNSLDEDGNMASMSREVETTSYEQEIDISIDKGKVDEALPDKSTDDEEDKTKSSIKTTENEILVETQKNVEGGVQDEEKAEPPQENAGQKHEENIQENKRTSSVEEDVAQQELALSKEENVGETNPTNELKTTAVEEKVVVESSDQEAPFITRRSLRYRTVTVQSTPRRKSKHLHRQEVESEKVTKDNICGNENDSAIQETADDLNIPMEKENRALNAEESIAEFENSKTKEGEGIIQENIEGKAEETGAKDDAVEEGNEVLFEINESSSASPENTKQNKTQEEHFERDVQVLKEQEDEVSSAQEEEKPLQERENEEAVQGSSFGLEETAVERRTLRKRLTVEIAAPRKSKRLRKQEHDEDSEQVKEVVMEQTETVEVTFTADNVELSSDVPAAVFEGSNLGGEIQQKNAEGTKSDGDCNIHEDTKTDAGESQEELKEKIVNKPQTDEDNEEVMEQNSKKLEETGEMEEVIEQHVETEKQKLESSTNEGFTLVLEVEETSDQEENKADEESRVAMEAPKDIFTSAEKSDEGEENISDEDEKGLAIEKHVLKSRSSTSSSRRRSTRLQMHEPKKTTKEDGSDSESEVQQTAKQRHQRKRKAITDLTPARRSKRYVRGKNV